MPDAPILRANGIAKSYAGVQALQAVSFDMLPGEVHALVGENGAGKSTLIKIISGVYKPDSGSIKVDGQPIVLNNPREAQDKGIATIYQELSLYPALTVAENIFVGHAPKSRFGLLDWRATNEKARETLDSLDIHDMDANRQVGPMPVGHPQRP